MEEPSLITNEQIEYLDALHDQNMERHQESKREQRMLALNQVRIQAYYWLRRWRTDQPHSVEEISLRDVIKEWLALE